MLGNYEKDGRSTLRPQVTAFLFAQTIEMRKKYGRRKWLGLPALVSISLVLLLTV